MSLQKVVVDLGARSYPVYIGDGIDKEINLMIGKATSSRKLFVVTDRNLYTLHASKFVESLKERGWMVNGITIEATESNKSYDQVVRIITELVKNGFKNDALIIGFGGGIICDLVAYAASTYLGGVPYLLIPTTFSAMIDGAIGGYHTLNFNGLKDQLACVYQPAAVICELEYLRSLSQQEYSNGLAELIKYAVVHDAALFSYMESNLMLIKGQDPSVMSKIITRAINLKALYVKSDEFNTSAQLSLDYGHTVGHAFEYISGYRLSHGVSVGLGMLVAARVARDIGQLPYAEYHRIKSLITEFGLPTNIGDCNVEGIIEAVKHDRKFNDFGFQFIIPLHIGKTIISDKITFDMINQALVEE